MADKNAPSAGELSKATGGLKKVTTKEGSGPADAEIAAFAKVYKDNGGDLNKIAKALGVKFKKDAKFADGKAFAKSFLAGLCLDE